MKKGFTLIELLVVISLMALLSFIVLASMDSAREKGRDAQVKLLSASLKAQAERYYSVHGSYYISEYDNVCVSSPEKLGFSGFPFDNNGFVGNPSGLLRDVLDTVSIPSKLYVKITSPGSWNQVTCHASVNNWVVDIPQSDSGDDNAKMYCIDNVDGGEHDNNYAIGANNIDCFLNILSD